MSAATRPPPAASTRFRGRAVAPGDDDDYGGYGGMGCVDRRADAEAAAARGRRRSAAQPVPAGAAARLVRAARGRGRPTGDAAATRARPPSRPCRGLAARSRPTVAEVGSRPQHADTSWTRPTF